MNDNDNGNSNGYYFPNNDRDALFAIVQRQVKNDNARTPEEIETSIRVGILNGQGLLPVLAEFCVKTALEVCAKIDGLSPGIARQLRTDVELALFRALKTTDEIPPDDEEL